MKITNKIKQFVERKNEPKNKGNSVGLVMNDWDSISCGYIPLAKNPEVLSAINRLVELIAPMSIYLMQNEEDGNKRIENALSRKIDISPNEYMTRYTFMSGVVRALLLEGDGNAVIYPQTKNGLIDNLYLLEPDKVRFEKNGFGYRIIYDNVAYEPQDLCHILLNPSPERPWQGNGYKVSLKNIVQNIEQANKTKKAFMEDKWKPSLVVHIEDASLTDDYFEEDGKEKILNNYLKTSKAGTPWLLPEGFKVDTIKPLSLNDLSINQSIELDKKTVASLLGVPPFILGIGEFNQKEWNNFINTRVKAICVAIEQSLTKSLLISENMFFRLNYRSLYSYDLSTLQKVASGMMRDGVLDGNEYRNQLGYSPREGLNKLVILENFIPIDKVGNQKKLGGDDDDEET